MRLSAKHERVSGLMAERLIPRAEIKPGDRVRIVRGGFTIDDKLVRTVSPRGARIYGTGTPTTVLVSDLVYVQEPKTFNELVGRASMHEGNTE